MLLEFPIAKTGLYIKNNYNQNVLDFLFYGNGRMVIAQDSFYTSDMLMPLLRNAWYKDSLSVRGLIEAMFLPSEKGHVFIPEGEYCGYELLKMVSDGLSDVHAMQ